MSKVKIEQFHAPIFDKISACYLQHYSFKKEYFANLHDPERKQHHGYSVQEEFEMADRDLREQNSNVTYTKKHYSEAKGIFEITFMNYHYTIEAIKQVIREQMIFAYDYSENKYIVRRAYRKALMALNLLVLNEPKFKDVTARFFIQNNNLN